MKKTPAAIIAFGGMMAAVALVIMNLVGLIPVAISFFFKGKITPICTAFAYIVGFIAGVIFQTDGVDVGGGTTNNLWIIWVVVFVCLTLAGIICEKFIGSVKKATK